MVLVGPSAAVTTPPTKTSPTVLVPSVAIDLIQHVGTILYGSRLLAAPLPMPLQTQLEAWVQATIETDQGWAPGSSTIVTP
jgi:hypothetical protein